VPQMAQSLIEQDIATLAYNRLSAFSKADDGVYTHPPLLNTARSGFTPGLSILGEHNTYTRAGVTCQTASLINETSLVTGLVTTIYWGLCFTVKNRWWFTQGVRLALQSSLT